MHGSKFVLAQCSGISFDLDGVAQKVRYGGFPPLAYLGFGIAAHGIGAVPRAVVESFAASFHQMSGRSQTAHDKLLSDDVSLLGIVDGLLECRNVDAHELVRGQQWLQTLVQAGRPTRRESRVWQLSADLLDGRGRLRARPRPAELESFCVDLCLRRAWPAAYHGVEAIAEEEYRDVAHRLLSKRLISAGDLEGATARLIAVDVLLDFARCGERASQRGKSATRHATGSRSIEVAGEINVGENAIIGDGNQMIINNFCSHNSKPS